MAHDAVVHLIDDDDGVRQGLAFLLTSKGFAVRVYESASAFLGGVEKAQPGCIVTDIRMPGISGLELQRQLKAWQIPLPVIVMTGHGDVALAVETMKAGAVDFLEKPFSDEALVSAIKLAIHRYERSSERDHEVIVIKSRLDKLSAREAEVLQGLVAGQSNKTIAYDLNISPRTVEVHRANIMIKMEAANLPELVRLVFLVEAKAQEP
jgi:two-component system response regulator FixJ